jgi:maltose phosphorylase
LTDYGVEVLLGIARFWTQRISWSEERNKYVMLGVTGPNEYENNVNNNWYTNYVACWCLRYAKESMEWVKKTQPQRYTEIVKKTHFDELNEWAQWMDIVEKMHFPEDKERQIFLQQDGYMDKEQILVKDLDPAQRPLNQKWSWDRILRSCFIKQADVLQGLYFFEDNFDIETIRRNFHFYEARTVHESSLSPCVHAILAAKIGEIDKAYELYLRTSRLDLDDYNKEVNEGLHITSMAGSWLAVIQGFAGMRVRDGKLSFDPKLPKHWTGLSFKLDFRGEVVTFKV